MGDKTLDLYFDIFRKKEGNLEIVQTVTKLIERRETGRGEG